MHKKGSINRNSFVRKSYLSLFICLFVFSTLLVPAAYSGSSYEFFRIFAKPDYNTSGNGIVETQDGYIVTGAVIDKSDSSHWGRVLKIDKNGTSQWEKELGKKARNSEFKKVVMSKDGWIILTGWVNVIPKPQWQAGSFSAASGWVVKLRSGGGVAWDKRLQINEVATYEGVEVAVKPVVLVSDIKLTQDDNMIIAGDIRYGISDEPIFWKLDAKGNVLWSKRINRKETLLAEAIYTLRDGSFLVGGHLIDIDNNTSSIWLAKLDSHGNVLWEKEFKYRFEYITIAITELNDGSLIVGSVIDHKEQKHIWLSKLKTNGNVEWEKKAKSPGLCKMVNIWNIKNNEIVAIGGTCSNERERIWAISFSNIGEMKSIKKFLPAKNLVVFQAIPEGKDGFIAVGSGAKQTDGSAAWVFKTKINTIKNK